MTHRLRTSLEVLGANYSWFPVSIPLVLSHLIFFRFSFRLVTRVILWKVFVVVFDGHWTIKDNLFLSKSFTWGLERRLGWSEHARVPRTHLRWLPATVPLASGEWDTPGLSEHLHSRAHSHYAHRHVCIIKNNLKIKPLM